MAAPSSAAASVPSRSTGAAGAPAPAAGAAGSAVPANLRPHANEIHLLGRLSAASVTRELPSGASVTTFRLVVDRPAPSATRSGSQGTASSIKVDTIDIACWSARTQRTAQLAQPGQLLEVSGALRRRFYATPAGRASRYEVEATMVRRVKGQASAAS